MQHMTFRKQYKYISISGIKRPLKKLRGTINCGREYKNVNTGIDWLFLSYRQSQ